MANTNLTNQRQVFVEEYVRSGDHLEAAKKARYKDTHTLRNQACKLRRECADQITEELHRNFAEIAPRALNILSDTIYINSTLWDIQLLFSFVQISPEFRVVAVHQENAS